MKAITIQKNIVTSPRKLQLVASMVRQMKPEQALITLQFVSKAAALPLSKAIKTVMANARNMGMDLNNLSFEKMEINEGPVYKRARAAGRGFVSPYKRRTSHIKIILTDVPRVSDKGKVKSQKLESKEQMAKPEDSGQARTTGKRSSRK